MNIKNISGIINNLIIEDKDEIHIKNNTIIKNINITNNSNAKLIIEDNSALDLGTIINIDNITSNINIETLNNTNTIIYLGIKAKNTNNLNIKLTMLGNDSNATIKVRCVGEESSQSKIITSGKLLKSNHNNTFLEDVKFLNEEDSYIYGYPELLVDSNDVVANHNMSVGPISEEVLFFLECKGINRKEAKNIIKESFIKSMERNKDYE